jgi:hypothetical protein
MRAVKARFDGDKIVLPKEAEGAPPGEVIVVFPGTPIGEGDAARRSGLLRGADDAARRSGPLRGADDAEAWLAAQQESFGKAWDNEEDSVYDAL